jgi:hypothetical protein
MSVATMLLLLGAGFSETAGRILPIVARRPTTSSSALVTLFVSGTVVEAVGFAVWPALAGVLLAAAGHPVGDTTWPAGVLVVLLFAALLAFPFLGPALHLLVALIAGVGLTDHLASGTSWAAPATAVAVAGVTLWLATVGLRALISGRRRTPDRRSVPDRHPAKSAS